MPSIDDQQGSYIPQTDSGVRDWLNNFASVVAQNPAAVGMTTTDSATLTNLAAAYDAAYVLATNPLTRTTPNVNDKDAARNQAVETFRVYASQIKKNLGVSEQQKLALGLHIDDSTRSPIPAPTTYPLLAVVRAENGVHEIRYADSNTPASRAKPPGATHLQLFRIVGDDPSAAIEDASLVGVYTRQPIQVAYGPADAGKTASYYARWVTHTGLTGPWSAGVAMTIAFGGPINLQSAA